MVLLTEARVSSEATRIFKDADEIRIAVAFWGKGALSQLGGLQNAKSIKVICNLDSGACNPSELRKVLAVAPVRTHERLHAKVYWTPQAVIVGSSNASTNGLWGEGGALDGWREANILSTDPALIADVKAWFDARWDETREVTEELLRSAQPIWRQGQKEARRGAKLKTSIFAAHLESPEHPIWRRVKVAFTTKPLSAKGKKKHKAAIDKSPKLEPATVFEGWSNKFGPDDIVIDVDGLKAHRNRGSAGYEIEFAVADTNYPPDPDLSFFWPTDTAWVPSFGRFRLSNSDKAALTSIFETAMQLPGAEEDDGVVISIAKACQLIAAVGSRR